MARKSKNTSRGGSARRAPADDALVLEEVEDQSGMTLDVGLILTTFLLLAGGLTYLFMLYNERYGAQN